MTENEKDFLSMVSDAGRKNEKFLRDNAGQVQNCFGRVIDLTNDSISYLSMFTSSADHVSAFVKQAMAFFVYLVMMPASYSVYLNMMAGNLSACFRELRLMCESLAKCYLADLRYPTLNYWQDKLDAIETFINKKGKKQNRVNVWFLEEMDKEFNTNRRFKELWKKLSGEGHLRGFAKRVINMIERDSIPPPVFPWEYDDDYVDDLKELGNYVVELRELTMITMQQYARDHRLTAEKAKRGNYP